MPRDPGGPGRRAVCGGHFPVGDRALRQDTRPFTETFGANEREAEPTLVCASVCAGSVSLAESLCICALNSGGGPVCTWRTRSTGRTVMSLDNTNPSSEAPPPEGTLKSASEA